MIALQHTKYENLKRASEPLEIKKIKFNAHNGEKNKQKGYEITSNVTSNFKIIKIGFQINTKPNKNRFPRNHKKEKNRLPKEHPVQQVKRKKPRKRRSRFKQLQRNRTPRTRKHQCSSSYNKT